MRRWIWRILLAALVSAALAGTALAVEDENFTYTEQADGTLEVKTYKTAKRTDRNQRSVVIPDMVNGKAVTSIGTYAFGGNGSSDPQSAYLEFITIPNSVKHIGQNAFTGASALDSIEIPGGVVIDSHAFQGTKNVREIVIHDDVNDRGEIDYRSASIGVGAFQDCKNLQKVVLPSSVMIIEEDAFNGCSELREIVIPFSVQQVNKNAFAGCNSLRNVVFCRSEVEFGDKDSLPVASVFPTLSNITYIHCIGDSPTYRRFIAAVKKLAPSGTADADAFAAERVHPIQMSPAQEVPDAGSISTPRCEKLEYDPVTNTFKGMINGKITTRLICGGYDRTVTKEIIKEDGTKETETTKEHVDCTCEVFKNTAHTYTIEREVSAAYHKPVKVDDIASTCIEHGYENIIECEACGKRLYSEEQKLIGHKYASSKESEERLLFEGYCADPDKSETPVKSLTLVTKKCSVCGHAPICYICQKLELDFKEADAKLETAKSELEGARAKVDATEKAWQEASEAQKEAVAERTKASVSLGAANVMLIGLKAKEALIATKVTSAEAALKAAQDDLAALGPNAAPDQIADAEKAVADAQEALDALKPEEDAIKEQVDAAEKTKEEANLAYDRADIAKNEADKAEKETKDKFEEAKETLKKLTDFINNDPGAAAARTALRDHLITQKDHWECAECVELIKAIGAAENEEKRTEAENAYAAHEQDPNHARTKIEEGAVSGTEPDKPPEHQYLDPVAEPNGNGEIPECGTGGYVRVTYWQTCKICGHKEKTGKEDIIEAADHHTPPPGIGSTVTKEPSCTEEGLRVYDDYECVVCHKKDVKGEEEIIPKLEHVWVSAGDKIIKEATCVEEGLKRTGDRECKLCGEVEKGTETVIPRTGHKWGDPVPVNEGKDDKAPTCGDPGTAYVTVTCPVCGTVENQTIEIPPTGQHEWGEWDRVKEPTASEEGLQRRTCSLCHQVDERAIPALGECAVHDYGPWETVKEPTATEDGLRKRVCKVCGHEDTEKIDATGGGTTPDPDATDYVIECIQTTNGSISAPSSARRGSTVSVSFSPDSGYELDQVRVTQTGGAVVNVSGSGSRRTFTMPAAKVEVRATFSRIITSFPDWSDSSSGASSRWTDPSQTAIQGVPHLGASQQLFYDIPVTHWAAGEIGWASQMGYMNGNRWGDFDPDGPMTFQQMWMVLARVNGYWPSNMEDAKRWAVEGGFAEGANPAVAITRHQMVTALFRCARLMGGMNNNFASLAGYTDSRTVPASARNAMAWAVANGIIGGTSNGRLEPNQTITRAQFAVILYRFSQRM